MLSFLLSAPVFAAPHAVAPLESKVQRIDAVQQSIDGVGKFALSFSAAVRQPSEQNLEAVKKDIGIILFIGNSGRNLSTSHHR